jgi:hypothetical protein
MKKLFLLFLLAVPFWSYAQEESLIFESNTLTPMPSQVLRFEAAVAAHNKNIMLPVRMVSECMKSSAEKMRVAINGSWDPDIGATWTHVRLIPPITVLIG